MLLKHLHYIAARVLFREQQHSAATRALQRNLIRSRFLCCGVALAVSVFASSLAEAQKTCAGIVGRVTTPEGWVIPGATISLLNKATKKATKVHTDGSGEYAACLSPGSYDVVASALGFKGTRRKSIKVEVSGTSIIDFPMKRGKPVTSHSQVIALH